MHRCLEEEAQEALDAITTSTSCEVAQQGEVEQQWSSEDRVAAEEVDLDLHRIAHPSEDVDVVPSLLVVVARWIIVDTYLVIVLCILVIAMTIEIRLNIWLEDGLQVESLLTSLVWKLAGSSSTRPSRLPRMLVENQPFKPRQRVPMIGAKPLLTRV